MLNTGNSTATVSDPFGDDPGAELEIVKARLEEATTVSRVLEGVAKEAKAKVATLQERNALLVAKEKERLRRLEMFERVLEFVELFPGKVFEWGEWYTEVTNHVDSKGELPELRAQMTNLEQTLGSLSQHVVDDDYAPALRAKIAEKDEELTPLITAFLHHLVALEAVEYEEGKVTHKT